MNRTETAVYRVVASGWLLISVFILLGAVWLRISTILSRQAMPDFGWLAPVAFGTLGGLAAVVLWKPEWVIAIRPLPGRRLLAAIAAILVVVGFLGSSSTSAACDYDDTACEQRVEGRAAWIPPVVGLAMLALAILAAWSVTATSAQMGRDRIRSRAQAGLPMLVPTEAAGAILFGYGVLLIALVGLVTTLLLGSEVANSGSYGALHDDFPGHWPWLLNPGLALAPAVALAASILAARAWAHERRERSPLTDEENERLDATLESNRTSTVAIWRPLLWTALAASALLIAGTAGPMAYSILGECAYEQNAFDLYGYFECDLADRAAVVGYVLLLPWVVGAAAALVAGAVQSWNLLGHRLVENRLLANEAEDVRAAYNARRIDRTTYDAWMSERKSLIRNSSPGSWQWGEMVRTRVWIVTVLIMAATNWLLFEPARNESAHAISEDPGAMSVAGAIPWLLGLATAILVAGAVFAYARVVRLKQGWNANVESRISELRVKAQEIFNSE